MLSVLRGGPGRLVDPDPSLRTLFNKSNLSLGASEEGLLRVGHALLAVDDREHGAAGEGTHDTSGETGLDGVGVLGSGVLLGEHRGGGLSVNHGLLDFAGDIGDELFGGLTHRLQDRLSSSLILIFGILCDLSLNLIELLEAIFNLPEPVLVVLEPFLDVIGRGEFPLDDLRLTSLLHDLALFHGLLLEAPLVRGADDFVKTHVIKICVLSQVSHELLSSLSLNSLRIAILLLPAGCVLLDDGGEGRNSLFPECLAGSVDFLDGL